MQGESKSVVFVLCLDMVPVIGRDEEQGAINDAFRILDLNG